MPEQFKIGIPSDFNFKTAVYSHGWCDLSPFKLDGETWELSYVFSHPDANRFSASIHDSGDGIVIETDSLVADRDRLIRDVRHILRLDEDLGDFYSQSNKQKRLRWVAEMSAGRLLRSPTVWEDLVKTICTTNCSWSLTKIMVGNLVEKLGAPAANGDRAFPDARAMASVGDGFYRDEIRAGYRSPYFVELSETVASGKLDPELWLSSELPTAELKKEMKKVKGVGDYAAENLLKLVGRYDGLALDSWLRSQFYKKHNSGSVCDDKQIALFYEKFGCWRGLAIWCDMTEKWH
jgi:N-glycosylase/DNA lyase